jgi:hypothetical protein
MTLQNVSIPPEISKLANDFAKKINYEPNSALIACRQALIDYTTDIAILSAFDRSIKKLGLRLYFTADSVFHLYLRETHTGFIASDATHQNNAIFFVLCLLEEVNAHDIYEIFRGHLNVEI